MPDVHARVDSPTEDVEPLVSVIVAAFNAASHIEAACRSALGQTYTNLELIAVDDGSTDDTGLILSRLAAADARMKVVRQQNRGVAAARNAAIEVAGGEFLAPLDADDLWDARKLELQVARMLERGPATALVYCWWVSIDSHDRILDRSPAWDVEGRAIRELIEVNFTGNASVPLFRRDVVVSLGGYDRALHEIGCQGCEDWDLAIRVAERHDVAVAPKALVAYRRHSGAMSTSCDVMWSSQAHVIGSFADRHPEFPGRVFERSRGQFALYLAGVSLWAGDHLGACRWALRTRPLGLLLAVAPHIGRLLMNRVIGSVRSSGTSTLNGSTFADAPLPTPSIPYSVIYARHWMRERRAGGVDIGRR